MDGGLDSYSWNKFKTRLPFSRRSTSCLLIESQTLTIWPWNDLDLDLRQVKLSLTDVQVAKLTFSMRWPWPWSNDLDTQTWPRYGQDVTPYQKWSFYVNWFKSYSPNTQTHRHTDTDTQTQTHRHDENITAYAEGKKAKYGAKRHNEAVYCIDVTKWYNAKHWKMNHVTGCVQSDRGIQWSYIICRRTYVGTRLW